MTESSEAKDLYKQGMTLYGQGKHGDAIDCYQKALELDPDWAEALQALAMAQMHAGALDEAVTNAERLIELAPEDPLAFTSLSMIYQRKERIDDAEKAQARARMLSWKQELKTNPDAPPPDGMSVVQ